MAQFDYFKQYVSEQNRIKAKIQEEENPIHREHIVFFSEMVNDMIMSAVPAMIKQNNEDLKVNVQTLVNGKAVRDGDLMAAIRDAAIRTVKKMVGKS